MRPNNGVDYILTSQELIKHDTASVRQHVSAQKWHKWHTPSLPSCAANYEAPTFSLLPPVSDTLNHVGAKVTSVAPST